MRALCTEMNPTGRKEDALSNGRKSCRGAQTQTRNRSNAERNRTISGEDRHFFKPCPVIMHLKIFNIFVLRQASKIGFQREVEKMINEKNDLTARIELLQNHIKSYQHQTRDLQ
jgi:hypothetical protein